MIEGPANPVIDKLRCQTLIASSERRRFAVYMANMVYRVPNFRNMARDIAPQATANTALKHKAILKDLAAEGTLDHVTAAKAIAQIDSWEAKYTKTLPPEAEEAIKNPWPSWDSYDAIWQMHWRVGVSSGPAFFLISDNPAYYFSAFGMAHPEAELILPISSTVAIHVSHRPLKQHGFIPFDQNVVNEINRRIASGARRFVFYHEQQNWILPLTKTTTEQLNRINWIE